MSAGASHAQQQQQPTAAGKEEDAFGSAFSDFDSLAAAAPASAATGFPSGDEWETPQAPAQVPPLAVDEDVFSFT
jgi:hypothetical protein